MKIISVIKDGTAIDKILAHLQYKFEPLPLAAARPRARDSASFPKGSDCARGFGKPEVRSQKSEVRIQKSEFRIAAE